MDTGKKTGLVFITFGWVLSQSWTRIIFFSKIWQSCIRLTCVFLLKTHNVYPVKWAVVRDTVREFSQFPVVLQPRPALPSEVPHGHAPSSHALFSPSRSAQRAKQEGKEEHINTCILITHLNLTATEGVLSCTILWRVSFACSRSLTVAILSSSFLCW